MSKNKLPTLTFRANDVVGCEIVGTTESKKQAVMNLQTSKGETLSFLMKVRVDKYGVYSIKRNMSIPYDPRHGQFALDVKVKPSTGDDLTQMHLYFYGSSKFVHKIENLITMYEQSLFDLMFKSNQAKGNH